MSGYTLSITLSAILYFALLIAIGVYSYKKTSRSAEDYFMANRSFGPLVLILSVFATNLTAFYMIGIPAQAYRQGIGVWGMVGVAVAILTAVCIYVFGYREWVLGKKYGFITQAEMFEARFESRSYGIVLFIITVIFLIPYIITSLVGAALALEVFTNGAISYTAATIVMAVIVLLYTTFGGMRGTAYTNVLQGIIFIVVGIVSFFAISSAGGGLNGITQKLLAAHPELLQRAGVITVKEWFTTMLLPPIAVVAYPHIFSRILTGKNTRSIKRLCLSYPILYFLTYLPIVYIGIWGVVLVPGLAGKAADSVVPMLFSKYLPPVFVGIGFTAILAAIMSSIDAMFLTVSTLFTRDVLKKFYPDMDSQAQFKWGRIFVILAAVIAVIGTLIRPASIFSIALFMMAGFVLTLIPTFGGLYWRRANKYGALASLVVPEVLLPFFTLTPYFKWAAFGMHPIIVLGILSVVLLVVVSLATPPPSKGMEEKFFAPFDKLFGRTIEAK